MSMNLPLFHLFFFSFRLVDDRVDIFVRLTVEDCPFRYFFRLSAVAIDAFVVFVRTVDVLRLSLPLGKL